MAAYNDSSDENIRDIHLVKPVPSQQVGFQPNAIVMTQKDPAFKENEYASMRLLSHFPDVMYDRENIVNQSRDPRICRDHMYGDSPQAEHKHLHTFDTYSAANPESGVQSQYATQYFDIDPEDAMYKCHSKDCMLVSSLPARGSKKKCHLAGVRGSGGEVKFTVVDYGTARKLHSRASYPGDAIDDQVANSNQPGQCTT